MKKHKLLIVLIVVLVVVGVSLAFAGGNLQGLIFKFKKPDYSKIIKYKPDYSKADIRTLLYDLDGRLTDYARSLAPKMEPLNLNNLQKIHPESYGNNYFAPGTYTVHVGDGFGKGNFLIKFTEFSLDDSRTYFEVFKKESNGNYYHFPTDKNSIYKHQILDLFGIPIEFNVDTFGKSENVLVYHSDCSDFYDYCSDETSYFYADGSSKACNWRCPFSANDDEVISQKGIFSAIFPKAYAKLANFTEGLLEQCYSNDVKFLGFDPQKPRIGVKIILDDSGGPMTGTDEYVIGPNTVGQLDGDIGILDSLISEKESTKCPNYLNLGHELTHLLTKEMGGNYGLNEGIAEFVGFQNGHEKEYVCSESGWRTASDASDVLNNYANLSSNPGDPGSPSSSSYYATGYCFWKDYVEEYGYPNFVKAMQKIYINSRGTGSCYLWDVFKEVNGGYLDQKIVNRYGLTKESTFVKICEDCEMFK